MNFSKAKEHLKNGCVVRSKTCEYKCEDGILYWRWIGEREWTCPIQDDEKEGEWCLVKVVK